MTKKVLMIGGLGNASVIAHAMSDANQRGYKELECVGFINDRDGVTEIEGFPILGGIEDIPRLLEEDYYFINTIFKIDGQKERVDFFHKMNIPDERLVTFIHPMAYVAPNVKFGPGCVVMPNASISPGTEFGKSCRIMVGCTIGHNNKVGNFCFFAANSCTGSFLNIGEGVTISLNSCVREFLTIENYATIAMGAVVLKNVAEKEIWAGNPAKFLRYAQ